MKEARGSFIAPGNQATSVQDPKIRSWPGDNGHKGRGRGRAASQKGEERHEALQCCTLEHCRRSGS